MALATMITAPADVERALEWVKRSDPSAAGTAISELTATDLRADVAKITAPVLLLGAPANAPAAMRPALEKAYAAQLAQVPSARVKMAPTARHFIMLDDPQWLFAAIDELLSGR
jgi:pimeloyl-ACP methyl ester carboxylesterase